ncbi:MAG: hypothetical protein ACRDXD_07990 [Acidimicrobiia bacterium]
MPRLEFAEEGGVVVTSDLGGQEGRRQRRLFGTVFGEEASQQVRLPPRSWYVCSRRLARSYP